MTQLPPGVLPPGVSNPQEPPPAPDTPLVALARLIEQAPRYALDFVLGMLIAVFSDATMTALALGSALLGLAVGSVWLGGASFFLIYVVMRTVNNVPQAIAVSGTRVAAALERLGFGSPGGSAPE